MEEERYNYNFEKLGVVFGIFFIVLTPIISLIYYNIFVDVCDKNSRATYESTYEYLDKIANNVIEKDGINIDAISKEGVKYKITHKDGKIIFNYSIDNDKQSAFTNGSMTVILSEDFQILNKKADISLKEGSFDKLVFFYPALGFGIATCFFIFCVGLIIYQDFRIHNKKTKKEIWKNLS